MNTRTPRIVMSLSAFAAVLLVSVAASAATVPVKTPEAPAATYASFVSVCRDHHGSLDRRACRHNGRLDPQRVAIALR